MGLCRVIQPDLSLDIGTYHGGSARALSCHARRVISYDIVALDDIGNAYSNLCGVRSNIEQRVIDLADQDLYASQWDLVSQADLILMDGPKDARFEYVVTSRLIRDMKPGSILILDDVRFANIQELWAKIDKPRIDVGSFAYSSGTGIMFI